VKRSKGYLLHQKHLEREKKLSEVVPEIANDVDAGVGAIAKNVAEESIGESSGSTAVTTTTNSSFDMSKIDDIINRISTHSSNSAETEGTAEEYIDDASRSAESMFTQIKPFRLSSSPPQQSPTPQQQDRGVGLGDDGNNDFKEEEEEEEEEDDNNEGRNLFDQPFTEEDAPSQNVASACACACACASAPPTPPTPGGDAEAEVEADAEAEADADETTVFDPDETVMPTSGSDSDSDPENDLSEELLTNNTCITLTSPTPPTPTPTTPTATPTTTSPYDPDLTTLSPLASATQTFDPDATVLPLPENPNTRPRTPPNFTQSPISFVQSDPFANEAHGYEEDDDDVEEDEDGEDDPVDPETTPPPPKPTTATATVYTIPDAYTSLLKFISSRDTTSPPPAAPAPAPAMIIDSISSSNTFKTIVHVLQTLGTRNSSFSSPTHYKQGGTLIVLPTNADLQKFRATLLNSSSLRSVTVFDHANCGNKAQRKRVNSVTVARKFEVVLTTYDALKAKEAALPVVDDGSNGNGNGEENLKVKIIEENCTNSQQNSQHNGQQNGQQSKSSPFWYKRNTNAKMLLLSRLHGVRWSRVIFVDDADRAVLTKPLVGQKAAVALNRCCTMMFRINREGEVLQQQAKKKKSFRHDGKAVEEVCRVLQIEPGEEYRRVFLDDVNLFDFKETEIEVAMMEADVRLECCVSEVEVEAEVEEKDKENSLCWSDHSSEILEEVSF